MTMVQELAGEGTSADFTELQNMLLGTESIEKFLHELAVLAAQLVTGGLSCGMTIGRKGRPVTVACSDPEAARADEAQYELDDGPCLHAMRDGHLVHIDDTAAKERWPRFEEQAASHGIRSCLALPLVAEGKAIGALTLYARSAAAFGTAATLRAQNFAKNASGAVALAHVCCEVRGGTWISMAQPSALPDDTDSLRLRDHRHAVPPGFAAQSSGSPGSACVVAYPGCGLPPGPG